MHTENSSSGSINEFEIAVCSVSEFRGYLFPQLYYFSEASTTQSNEIENSLVILLCEKPQLNEHFLKPLLDDSFPRDI